MSRGFLENFKGFNKREIESALEKKQREGEAYLKSLDPIKRNFILSQSDLFNKYSLDKIGDWFDAISSAKDLYSVVAVEDKDYPEDNIKRYRENTFILQKCQILINLQEGKKGPIHTSPAIIDMSEEGNSGEMSDSSVVSLPQKDEESDDSSKGKDDDLSNQLDIVSRNLQETDNQIRNIAGAKGKNQDPNYWQAASKAEAPTDDGYTTIVPYDPESVIADLKAKDQHQKREIEELRKSNKALTKENIQLKEQVQKCLTMCAEFERTSKNQEAKGKGKARFEVSDPVDIILEMISRKTHTQHLSDAVSEDNPKQRFLSCLYLMNNSYTDHASHLTEVINRVNDITNHLQNLASIDYVDQKVAKTSFNSQDKKDLQKDIIKIKRDVESLRKETLGNPVLKEQNKIGVSEPFAKKQVFSRISTKGPCSDVVMEKLIVTDDSDDDMIQENVSSVSEKEINCLANQVMEAKTFKLLCTDPASIAPMIRSFLPNKTELVYKAIEKKIKSKMIK